MMFCFLCSALFAEPFLFAGGNKIMKNSKVRKLTESAVMAALSIVLSFIKLADMPYGGSVTVAAMAPIVFIAYRNGPLWGLGAGFVCSVVQLLSGTNAFSYATSAAAVIAIALLDYFVAFTVFGLGGLFRKMKNQTAGMLLGAFLCSLLRYLCHVISGCTVWAGVSIPSADGLLYSLIYNSAYMIPETVVLLLAVLYLSRVIDFRAVPLTTRVYAKQKGAVWTLVGLLAAIAAVIYDFIVVFASIQTEEGFDITGISGAPWATIGIVTAVAAGVFVVCEVIHHAVAKERA